MTTPTIKQLRALAKRKRVTVDWVRVVWPWVYWKAYWFAMDLDERGVAVNADFEGESRGEAFRKLHAALRALPDKKVAR